MPAADVLLWVLRERDPDIGITFYKAVCLETGDESIVYPTVAQAIDETLRMIPHNFAHNHRRGVMVQQLERLGWVLDVVPEPPRRNPTDLFYLIERYLDEYDMIQVQLVEVELPDYSEDLL